ncbi:hypothetical protein CJ030_MR7G010613 [Morella rubra]|uniref:FAF domain-containing protein n=1 Tax=Morella rubra TaxID=262757 RepID=A0A6A1UZC6_9ROSI|nr:hypothetical protein CJ030_MR7G010613 [Morella rubra]
MQSPNASHTQQLEAGIKAPILPPEEHRRPYSCQSFDNMLSSTSAYSVIGDYIGMESCLDLEDNGEVYSLKGAGGDSENESRKAHNRCRVKRDQRLASKKKEFPPPIPLLAQTGNLPSHMPWVLKREYTSDGRLILTEEKVRHHEYFQAHRANGRLTLKLVPIDDEFWLPSSADEQDNYTTNEELPSDSEEKEEAQDNDTISVGGDELASGDGDEVQKEIVHESRFCNMESGSCIFAVPVGAIRPVH